MAGLIPPPLFGKGESVLRRIKLLLAVVAALSMLMVMAAPAMANAFDHNEVNHNDLLIDNFNDEDFDDGDFDDEDFDDGDFDDEDFDEFEDCAWVASFDDQVLIVCDA
jgi:hypothetical protein